MGLGGGYGGQKVLHEAENMPPTFNFLAGKHEAEENIALKRIINPSPKATPFQERTYRTNGARNSQIPSADQSWKGWVRISVNKPGWHFHVGLPK